MSGILQQVYERLWKAYGPQHWWPGDGPFEVIVGAVLTQNTSWKNVERAIRNLRDAGLMTPRRLARTPLPELEELIRPAGYYRIKARRLRNLLELIVKRYGGSLEQMFSTPMDVLREELLAVQGVGPETADS
ncbi:MAG TPA: endonuclease III domain-containing protein, partial [Thermoguttaceae bacterium]|nr:endonuclease III domain-containing protein [Thermoguttaceae bacterium]